jgi:hypothetical protein
MYRSAIACVALLAVAVPLQAQPPTVPAIALHLHPAVPTERPLKYELLPEMRDEMPGNAVVYYMRAMVMFQEGKGLPAEHPLWKWLEMPVKDLPKKEVHQFIIEGHGRQHGLFNELDLAARCSQCDWQLESRIRAESIGLLLPEIQQLRGLANLLQMKARLEIAEGHFDQALHTLQTGFKLARNTNRSPTLISALVAIAIAGQMAHQLDELVQQPGAPSLYATLTYLPSPLIDLRRPMEGERMLVDGLFPGLREAAADHKLSPLSPSQLQGYVGKVGEIMDMVNNKEAWSARLYLTGVAIKGYPEAKQYLLAHGWTAEQVDAMPMLQVAFLYSLARYDRLFDGMLQWVNQPAYVTRPGLDRWIQELKQDRVQSQDLGIVPLASMLIPAVEKVYEARTRIDRKIAALRCIEAIRLYATAHEGKLPDRLDQVTEVPVPLDPQTGKAFEYGRKGDGALLVAPPPAGQEAHEGNSLRYELTFQRP